MKALSCVGNFFIGVMDNEIRQTPARNKRNRNSLTNSCKENRYLDSSQSTDYWLVTKGRADRDHYEIIASYERAKHAFSHVYSGDSFVISPNNDSGDDEEPEEYVKLLNGYSQLRRKAIQYFYVNVLERPPMETW